MERLALGITRQLSIRGWDAELLFGEGPRSAEVRAWAERNGVPATTHPAVLSVMEPRRSWASVRDLYRLIRSRKPDVVNLHYGGAHISLKDVLAVRLARVPKCIVQVHLPVEWSESGGRKRALTQLAARLAGSVVVHSAAVQRVMLDAGVPAARITVVHPGLEVPAAEPDRADSRDFLCLPAGRFVVGTMARLVEHKGVADLIRAMADVPDAILLVAGDGPERARLEGLAEEVAPGRVRFLGMLNEDVDRFFAALDCFVLPSHREGFGLVLIEAALRGVPAIGTRIGGIEDAVVDGVTGVLVPSGDSEALASAIRALESEPGLRQRLAAAAYLRAMRDFTEEAMGCAEERVFLGEVYAGTSPTAAGVPAS